MICQVFVVWFGSGGDNASYHGVDLLPCRINPIHSNDGSSHTDFFLFIIAHHEIFNRKLQKCLVIYTVTIQWKPGIHIYTHLIYCLSTGKLYVGWKMFTYGLNSIFPTLFLLCAQQNVTTPLEIIANRWRFKTNLLHNNRGNTVRDREGWLIIPPSKPTSLSPTAWHGCGLVE